MQLSIAAFQQCDLFHQGFVDRLHRLEILPHQFTVGFDRSHGHAHAGLHFLRDIGFHGLEVFLDGDDLGSEALLRMGNGIDERIQLRNAILLHARDRHRGRL